MRSAALARRTLAISAFADLDFDAREAFIESEHVVVHVWVLAGNADVYVPEGVDVDVGGTILFGRRRDWGRDAGVLDRATADGLRPWCVRHRGRLAGSARNTRNLW